jgi:hypothetical protein
MKIYLDGCDESTISPIEIEYSCSIVQPFQPLDFTSRLLEKLETGFFSSLKKSETSQKIIRGESQ